jgi:hypothetical protein
MSPLKRAYNWLFGGKKRCFAENGKGKRHYIPLDYRALGREAREGNEEFHLREGSALYHAHSGAENSDIGPKNTYS